MRCAGLSKKNREAFKQMERMKAAGQLQGRKPAIPPRRGRKKAQDADGSGSTSMRSSASGEAMQIDLVVGETDVDSKLR